MDRVTAIFDNRQDAERAIDWLRGQGVPNDSISVIAGSGDGNYSAGTADRTNVDDDPGSDAARGAGTGALAGAGVGALFGLAAALIPGIGPFVTAGALATWLGSATAGAAVSGAIVGGTSGAVAGALSKWGLDQADADYYGGEIERGGTFLAVDLDSTTLTRAEILDAFRGFGGRFSNRSAMAA